MLSNHWIIEFKKNYIIKINSKLKLKNKINKLKKEENIKLWKNKSNKFKIKNKVKLNKNNNLKYINFNKLIKKGSL